MISNTLNTASSISLSVKAEVYLFNSNKSIDKRYLCIYNSFQGTKQVSKRNNEMINGYCSSENDNGKHDVMHTATAECVDWQSLQEMYDHMATCTDDTCECK